MLGNVPVHNIVDDRVFFRFFPLFYQRRYGTTFGSETFPNSRRRVREIFPILAYLQVYLQFDFFCFRDYIHISGGFLREGAMRVYILLLLSSDK